MSEALTYCASGCVVRGTHRPECEGECRGCQPRLAEIGQLCAWCWQRLQSDVATAPSLIRHLREMAQPTAGTKPPGDGRSHGEPAEGSILSGAIDAADEVHACLASWAHLILEEHPSGDQMSGPDEGMAVRTSTVAVLTGDIADEYGPYLRKSSIAGIRNARATTRLVAWLMPLLPWCAEQEWAGEMRREVGGLIRTTLARWPMQDASTKLAGRPCPECDQMTLTYVPPAWERAPFVVACGNPQCGKVYDENRWGWLCRLLGIEERTA